MSLLMSSHPETWRACSRAQATYQLNSKDNDPLLLFKTIFRHFNCFLSSVTTDNKDGNGVKLDVAAKITTEKLSRSVPLSEIFGISFISLQKHFLHR